MSNGVEYCLAIGDETGSITGYYDSGSAGDLSVENGTALNASWSELVTSSEEIAVYATYTVPSAGVPVKMHHYTKNLA